MQTPDRLYPVRDALPLMGVGLTQFYALLNQGRIAALKNGRRTFITESEIARYRATLPVIGRKEAASQHEVA